MTDRQRDRLLAVLTAVLAVSYIAAARGIEDSLLADEVGAGGVPQGVGLALLLAAVLLFGKSFVGVAAPPASASDTSAATPLSGVVLRTGALVALLLAYGLLLPWLGYALTVSLLVLSVGRLAGAPARAPLLLSAACAGPLLWALFDGLLKVRMPLGTVWG